MNYCPKFTVIIPVYNVAAYLAKCIDSVLKQEFKQYEVILIDDGSTDESGTICDKFAEQDKRIVVIHQKNKGLSAARNIGIENAKGEYILFLDSDDYWHDSSALNIIYSRLNVSNADILSFNYIGRCLDSILAQTHKRIEIIIVDDGSTDGTGIIIDQYASIDQRIIPIHKENGGVTSARIDGIKKASGEYLGFVDGDDYIEPEMFEKLLDNAIKYDADISHCGYQMVFPGRVEYYYNTGRIY